jgi:hypothetical protein
MATKLGIINNSLIRLGEPSIDSLTNHNPIIQGMVSIYDMIIEDSLASHPWKFALKTTTLTLNPSAPITDNYIYTYNKPADLIQPWRSYPLDFNYIIQGNLIYSNMASPWKWIYVGKTEPNMFPDYFSLYIALRLAAESAMLITQSIDQETNWTSRAATQLMKAANRDATMQPNDIIQNNSYLTEHYRGTF